MSDFALKPIKTNAEWQACHRMRKEDLFARYAPHIVYDPHHESVTDPHCKHYAFYHGKHLVGTAMTQHLTEEKIALRLIAIEPEHRNQGYGAVMLEMLEQKAKAAKYRIALMHAALPAVDFYRRHGYSEMDFYEEGIDYSLHVDLGKYL